MMPWNKPDFDVDEFIIFFCWPMVLAFAMVTIIIFIEWDKHKKTEYTNHPIEVEAK